MDCIRPISIRDRFGRWQNVPCNQCIACRINKSSEWAHRILLEKRMSDSAVFLTLTYDEDHVVRSSLTGFTTLVKEHAQKFIKDIRNAIRPKKIRYFLVGEYGEERLRSHFHVIIFNHADDVRKVAQQCWTYGHVKADIVNEKVARYVAKYSTKILTGGKSEFYVERDMTPEFALMSTRPGIGYKWAEKYAKEIKQHNNIVIGGKKVPVPRYFKDKFYDEVDRRNSRDRIADKIIKKEVARWKDFVSGMTYDRMDSSERMLEERLKLYKKRKI